MPKRLTNFGTVRAQAEHVLEHEDLAVAGRRRADADGRHGNERRVISRASGSTTASTHHGEGSGRGHRLGIGADRLRRMRVAALHLEAADGVERLRRQADMAHDRDAALDQEADGLRHALAAFELHRAAAGLLQDPRGGPERFAGLSS